MEDLTALKDAYPLPPLKVTLAEQAAYEEKIAAKENQPPALIPSAKIARKFKKHEREALFPLYEEHVTYLLRMIKTVVDEYRWNLFLANIPVWQENKECHEVAINEFSDRFRIETHMNSLGQEFNYTTHRKAKNVSRSKRVRYIWARLAERWAELETVEPYAEWEINTCAEPIVCPYCEQTVGFIDEEGIEIESRCNCAWVRFDFRGHYMTLIVEGNDIDDLEITMCEDHYADIEDFLYSIDVREFYIEDELYMAVDYGKLLKSFKEHYGIALEDFDYLCHEYYGCDL